MYWQEVKKEEVGGTKKMTKKRRSRKDKNKKVNKKNGR